MISSFLKYLQFEKRYSAHTVLAYENDLRQYSDYLVTDFDSLTPQEATPSVLRSFLVFLTEQGLDPRSINRKIATLRTYYKFLLSREVIMENPTRKIRALKISRPLPQFVQEQDMNLLLDKVEFSDDFQGLRDRLILEFLYGTGARLAELLSLEWGGIDFSGNQIRVIGKRNKERIIPMHAELAQTLKIYKNLQENTFGTYQSGPVIVTNKGEPAYPMMVYKTVKKYLSLFTKVDKRSPHVLRHTFATHLLNKGADLNAIKDLLGHANLAATQVYTHNSMDKLRKVFEGAHPKA
jgi:integrase/recombinase XerC